MTGFAVGDVIRVAEPHYAYGAGTLTMHVAEVVSRGPRDGAVWAELRGRDVRPDGSLAPCERFASVRVDKVAVVRVPVR
ncbi:hypothetical protein GCM10010429_02450 [Micromonospora olivasterospora]|uniref:Uncharacterized protein n=1 Tax=Micromonospora olivasterospora TaxID=1880 RepID=A0A562IBN6_MICOL|nr:hypothetical protein JD77_03442 [Micromonospora olivasterospora]